MKSTNNFRNQTTRVSAECVVNDVCNHVFLRSGSQQANYLKPDAMTLKHLMCSVTMFPISTYPSIPSIFTTASQSPQALQSHESGSASLKRISRKRDMCDDINLSWTYEVEPGSVKPPGSTVSAQRQHYDKHQQAGRPTLELTLDMT